MSMLTDWNLAAGVTITEPGIYDLPADVYHGDPVKGGSLSSSGARKLLPPSCPALFKYQLDHQPLPTDDMTFGSAAHKLALHAGADIVEVDADSWRTNAAKDAKREALAGGKIPLLTKDVLEAHAMVTVLKKNPIAAALLNPERGRTEQTLVWQCPDTGVMCRAMLDFLPHIVTGRRMVLADYKTCPDASREKVSRSVWDLGYFIQCAWYLDGVKVLGLDRDPAMLFVFQERQAPFLVHVTELDATALEAGRFYMRQARRIYAECTASGIWPGHGNGEITTTSLPPWGENTYFRESGQ